MLVQEYLFDHFFTGHVMRFHLVRNLVFYDRGEYIARTYCIGRNTELSSFKGHRFGKTNDTEFRRNISTLER
ncbi:hypothetical protein D3C72_504770 [compost metagenome]